VATSPVPHDGQNFDVVDDIGAEYVKDELGGDPFGSEDADVVAGAVVGEAGWPDIDAPQVVQNAESFGTSLLHDVHVAIVLLSPI
jgi:hypothetical protein